MRKILFFSFVLAFCSYALGDTVVDTTNTTWRCTLTAWTYQDGTHATNRAATIYLVRTNDVAFSAFLMGLADGSISSRNIVSHPLFLDSRPTTYQMRLDRNVCIGYMNDVYASAVVFDKWSIPGKIFYLVSKPEKGYVGGSADSPGGIVRDEIAFSSAYFQSWKEVTDSAVTVLSVAK